jgi:hypothetical protein
VTWHSMGPPIFTWIRLGVFMSSHLYMLFIKHLNYLHMTSHTLDEFWHSDLSRNLGLTPNSSQVGRNSLWISHVIQGLVVWDYHTLFHNLIVDLCLVGKFNVSRISPWAPFLAPTLCNSWVTSNQELNPTQHLNLQPNSPQEFPKLVWTWAPTKQILSIEGLLRMAYHLL